MGQALLPILAATGSFASAGIGIYGMISQANAISEKAEIDQAQANENAKLEEIAADDAKVEGEFNLGQVKRNADKVRGAQVAGLAAQGIDANSGSASSILNETNTLSALDEMTVKNNAWKESWGHRVQANQYRLYGMNAAKAGANMAKNTLLTGGMDALSSISKGLSYLNQ